MNIVQARCPHCTNTLRIPADWLERPMRCKFCKNIFQAKTREPEPVASAAPTPVAPAAPAWQPSALPPPSQSPPGWDQVPASQPVPGPSPNGYFGQAPNPQPMMPGQAPGAMAGAMMPYPGAPAPHPVGFGFDEGPDENDKVIGKPRRRSKGNGNMIGAIVVGGLFLVTITALIFMAPQIMKAIEAPPHQTKLHVDDSKSVFSKKNIEWIKKNKGKQPTGPETTSPAIRPTPVNSSILPRRALFISPENYLLLNRTLFYREMTMNGDFRNTLLDRFTKGAPLDISPSQLYVLTDADLPPLVAYAPQKSVIEAAIKDFCESSRPQDRVVILFSGHACELEDKNYLVPIEGDKDIKESMIALDWVYDQLAKCKARQKIFIFDSFRYPPARGLELPDTGAMTENFDKQLQNPPPGVQVLSACIKGQQSLEFELGSVFQTALKEALKEMSLGAIVQPKDPIPVEKLTEKINSIMKEKLSGVGKGGEMMEKKEEAKAEAKAAEPALTQTARLSGKETENGAEPNPAEPVAKAVAFLDADKSGVQNKMLDEILSEIKMFPAMKASQSEQLRNLRASSLPPISKEKLDEFKDDGFNPFDPAFDGKAQEIEKMRDKFPIRVAAYDVARTVKDTMDIQMKEYFPNPGGPLDAKRKTQFLNEQKEPGLAIYDMEVLLDDVKKAAGDREKETSKRWQAHFDLGMARLQARLIYVYEYNNLIAQIRGDALPNLEPFHNGWRVNTSPKIQIKESKVKDMVKSVGKTWDRLAKEYPSTPWAVIAKREKNVSLGLQWVPTRD